MFAVLVAGAAFDPRTAQAQSCCGVAGEDELSVAGFERRAVFTSKLAVEHMLGRHDSRGDYHALDDGISATDAFLVLGAGVRMPFYELLQIHGSVPVRLQHRELMTDAATLVGLGDASLFLRWSALRDDERGFFEESSTLTPSLDLFVGAKAPTGPYDDGPDAHAFARTTGDGTWSLIGGVRAIKYLTAVHALRLSVRYDHRLVRETDGASGYAAFSPGDVVNLTLGYLGLAGMHWAYGITLDGRFTGPSSARLATEGELHALPGTSMRQLTLGAHLTRVLLMPKLDLTLGLAYSPPVDGLSRNISWEGLTGALTLRFHWMK